MKELNFYRIFKDEGVSFGWKHAKKDFWFFFQVLLLLVIAGILPGIINGITGRPYDASNVGDIISFILGIIFSFGLVKIRIRFAREQKADLKQLIDHDRVRFLRWILARVITSILIGLGIILLIIPGIYVAARLYFVEYFVIDQKMTAIEAVSASREVTKGHVWQIIGIWFLTFGISLLGFITLGIGLLWAIPTIYLAQAKLYNKIIGHTHHEE